MAIPDLLESHEPPSPRRPRLGGRNWLTLAIVAGLGLLAWYFLLGGPGDVEQAHHTVSPSHQPVAVPSAVSTAAWAVLQPGRGALLSTGPRTGSYTASFRVKGPFTATVICQGGGMLKVSLEPDLGGSDVACNGQPLGLEPDQATAGIVSITVEAPGSTLWSALVTEPGLAR